jgi:hypothetical protein
LHVGNIVVGVSSQVKGAITEEHGGEPREASRILTFLLSKAGPMHADPCYLSSPL